MGFFKRFFGSESGSVSIAPRLEVPKAEVGTESLNGKLRSGARLAEDKYDEIGSYLHKTLQPEDKTSGKPEGKSVFQKMKGWVNRKVGAFVESANRLADAGDVLDAMDYAKELGFNLAEKVNLADPAVQQVLAKLEGYKRLEGVGAIEAIRIVEAFYGYKNKLEVINLLHGLREQQKLDRELEDFSARKWGPIKMDAKQLMSLVNRAKETGVGFHPQVAIEVGSNVNAELEESKQSQK